MSVLIYVISSLSLQPFLVGKAVVPLRSCLTSPSLDLHTRLEVRSSSLTDAVKGHVTDKDPLIGHLQVRSLYSLLTVKLLRYVYVYCPQVLLQLVSNDRKSAKTPPLTSLEISPPVQTVESEAPASNSPTVKLTEPRPLSQSKYITLIDVHVHVWVIITRVFVFLFFQQLLLRHLRYNCS